MADRKKSRRVTPEQSAALDRIAARVRGEKEAKGRVLAFVDRRAEAEAMETFIVLKLKEAIEESGLSGYALAQRAGVAQSTISKFLSGDQMNLTIETLTRLCVELEVVVLIAPKPKRSARTR